MGFPESLIENGKAFLFIKREINRDKLSHAYMVSGADRGALLAFVLLAVRYSMCRDLCGQCPDCRRVISLNHPDVKVIDKDDKILVDDVKEIISGSVLKPFEDGDNFYIICDAANLNVQSQNKLLKTLEEAPAHTHFFLCTTRPDMLLNTVKSRVAKITLPPFTPGEITEALSREFPDNAGNEQKIVPLGELIRTAKSLETASRQTHISLAAEFSGGSLTTARDILSSPDKPEALKAVLALPGLLRTSKDVLGVSGALLKFKNHARFMLDAMETVFTAMLESLGENSGNGAQENEYGYSLYALSNIIPCITEAKMKLIANCNLTGVIETLLFNILEVKKKCRLS